ncbi:DUF1515 family protein [Rahnella aceris]|uniref:DUF1515 family protein n=1 Tax=Rahnella sp. (strain Y9602) TaxID=2703885 RepID=UPI0036637F06
MHPNDKNATVTPRDDKVSSDGGVNETTHQQWVMRSLNDLKDDLRESSRRVDHMHDKISDQSSTFERMAGALERVEQLLRDQSGKMDKIDTTFTKIKERIIGAAVVLGLVGAAIAYLFGQRLTEIVQAVLSLH